MGPSSEQQPQQQWVEVTRKLELTGLGTEAADRLRQRMSASDDHILQRAVGSSRAIAERRILWARFGEFVQSIIVETAREAGSYPPEPTYTDETMTRYAVTSVPR